MARLSDIIENFIKTVLSENGGQQVQIQRNELAGQFRCAPSQINYVLSTRFTYDKGYVIESRRGM
jgi:transcriptional regulator CtsR